MGLWDSQRVLVTGGGGLLGRRLVERLRSRRFASISVSRSAEYDLRLLENVVRLYRDTRPTLVIHLAAVVGGIGANQERPAEFFYDNLTMGIQLLDQAWRARVPKFVGIGTVCAYPKFAPVPFLEENLWDGYPEETNAAYGLAKKMLLVQSQAYRQQYSYNSIFLVPVNLYGPGDNFNARTSHVLPAVIRKCADAIASGERQIELWGDGSATREFLYVDDAAEGILLASERYDSSDPVNLGSGQEISIAEVANKVAMLVGFTGTIVWDESKPNGQPRRKLDVHRAEERFGFRATTSLDLGLKQTIDWYMAAPRAGSTASSPANR